jgi:hypothetical protein
MKSAVMSLRAASRTRVLCRKKIFRRMAPSAKVCWTEMCLPAWSFPAVLRFIDKEPFVPILAGNLKVIRTRMPAQREEQLRNLPARKGQNSRRMKKYWM